jgi:hypothetical protein
MLADVSLLLHEINDAVRVRRHARENQAIKARAPVSAMACHRPASSRRRASSTALRAPRTVHIDVRAGRPSPPDDAASLHVHAGRDVAH